MKQIWAFDLSNDGRGGPVYLTVAESKDEAIATITADITSQWGNREAAEHDKQVFQRMEPTVARSLDYYIGE